MKKIAAMLLLVLLAAGCAKTPAQTAKNRADAAGFCNLLCVVV